jgi:hypothetical protein
MKHLEHVRKRITEAFRKANEVHGITGDVSLKQPVAQASDLSTKQTDYYCENQRRQFQLHGETLIGAALRLPIIANSKPRRSGLVERAWDVGNLEKNYTAEEVIAEALKRSTETPKKGKKTS